MFTKQNHRNIKRIYYERTGLTPPADSVRAVKDSPLRRLLRRLGAGGFTVAAAVGVCAVFALVVVGTTMLSSYNDMKHNGGDYGYAGAQGDGDNQGDDDDNQVDQDNQSNQDDDQDGKE